MSGESVILFIGGKLQSAFCQPLAFSFGEFKQYRAAQGVVMKKAVDVSANDVTVGAERPIAVGTNLLASAAQSGTGGLIPVPSVCPM